MKQHTFLLGIILVLSMTSAQAGILSKMYKPAIKLLTKNASKGVGEIAEKTVKVTFLRTITKQVAKKSVSTAIKKSSKTILIKKIATKTIGKLAKVSPAMAKRATIIFGKKSGQFVSKAIPLRDAQRLIGYANRANSKATKKLLIKYYKKEGASIFERLSRKTILTYGLTASMIMGTYQVSAGTRNAIEHAGQGAGKGLEKSPQALTQAIALPINLLSTLLVCLTAISLWLSGAIPFCISFIKKRFATQNIKKTEI